MQDRQKKISGHEDVKVLFTYLRVIGIREAGLDEKSQQSITVYYINANFGEIVAVDIKSNIAGSKPRDLRDVRKYLVNPVNPV
jgi:hypothetical protein